jgi:hypothetical protein
MTRDDIIRLREECDQWAEDHLQCKGEYHPDFHTVSDERFAALVAAAEREACAQVCEEWGATTNMEQGRLAGNKCVAAIRARGQA